MEVDDYEIHSDLVERFILNGDKTAFRKMLNMNLNSNNNRIEKQKENLLRRQQFMKSMKQKRPPIYYNNFHMNHFENNYKTFKPGEINDFKLDFHNILQDPEYKDKCMRGNYKWGSMKFQMMKANLAKRKGISINEFKMPKIWTRSKNTNMELNGNFIMNNKDNNYKHFKPKGKMMNKKEDNKNSFQMNKFIKISSFNKRINEPVRRHTSQRIPISFNI